MGKQPFWKKPATEKTVFDEARQRDINTWLGTVPPQPDITMQDVTKSTRTIAAGDVVRVRGVLFRVLTVKGFLESGLMTREYLVVGLGDPAEGIKFCLRDNVVPIEKV